MTPPKPEKPSFALREAKALAEQLVQRFRRVCDRVSIAGSIRRGVAQVHDIELVAIPKLKPNKDLFGPDGSSVNLLWTELDGVCQKGDDARYLKAGDHYRQLLAKIPSGREIKVDFFTARPGNWGWIYLIRTGSANFSHQMAKSLNHAGYTSRDGWIRAMANPEKPIETREERDVFRLAKRQVVAPERRK